MVMRKRGKHGVCHGMHCDENSQIYKDLSRLRALPGISGITSALAPLRRPKSHNHRLALDGVKRLTKTDDPGVHLVGQPDIQHQHVIMLAQNHLVKGGEQLGMTPTAQATLKHTDSCNHSP